MSLDRPGFLDPVREAQAVFRAVLDAMARPGTVHAVAGPLDPPPPLGRAAAAVLLTLADADTPVWLGPGFGSAAEWLAFHAGVAPAAGPADAAFAVGGAETELDLFPAGSDVAPQDGATVILMVAALGTGDAFALRGPGVPPEGGTLRAEGLPDGFAGAWARNHARFPRGVEVILCAGDRLAALPRSVALTPED